jgi:hypothetical protein
MAGAKVVGIHGVNAPTGAKSKPVPSSVVKARDLSKDKIRAALINLFNNADDALFEKAEAAESNSAQALYFEAMRELRLQKKSIVVAVLSSVFRSFNTLPSLKDEYAHEQPAEQQETDLDDLSLIRDEELEYKVALEGMVQRVRSECGNELKFLNARFAHLMSLEALKDEDVPLSPESLCTAFVDGCNDLEIDIRPKLTIFKLFERYVLSEMNEVYQDLNKLLISDGVLPDLRGEKRVVRQQARTPSGNAGAGADSAPASESSSLESLEEVGGPASGVSLDTLRQLLHPQGAPMAGPARSSNDASVVRIPQSDLVNALSLFQGRAVDQLSSYEMPNHVIDFKQLLESRVGQVNETKNYSELDADMINLVSMLFEFILEDGQLQPDMKALISRLQIPLLKVALLDKTFFNKGGHPARKLLNEIASAAIGWNPPVSGKKDRFKEKLESLIDQVLQDFKDDVSIFDELLTDFRDFIEAEHRRGLLVEQRTRDSEKGRAATEQARKVAQGVINEALEKSPVPDMAVELLKTGWSQVLVLKFLKNGQDSKEWAAAAKLVDDLVWSLCPDPDEPEARSKLLKLIPRLVKQIREGFEEVSFDSLKAKGFLKKLEDQHVLSLQALQQQINLHDVAERPSKEAQKSRASESESVEDQDEAVSDLIRSTLELEDDFKQLHDACNQANRESQETEASAQESETRTAEMPKKQESIVLVEEAEASSPNEIDESSPFVQQVDRFVVGCWYEFTHNGKTERCKLAAVIKATDKYIFVNRSGIKVAEKKRLDLAKELKEGTLQALNDGLLFDRALESIITNLRS